MCDFCTQHGDGKTWYLNARNYSAELVNELERRKFIEHFYHEVIVKGNHQITAIEKYLHGWLFMPGKIRQRRTERSQKSHFGQIIPVEEIPAVLNMANSVVRVTCGCRWAAEKGESRVCYGLSTGPPHWYDDLDMDFFGSPDMASIEQLSREEAFKAMQENDRQGMVHSIWTFETPFIGAICNCDGRYCLAMRSTVGLKLPSMFRAEYVAQIDREKCSGCQACLPTCQFSALRSRGKKYPAEIDAKKCYGCGVCRAFCPTGAIELIPRQDHPVAREVWL